MVRDYSERVDVALLRWVTVLQAETGGVQQFRCHVSDGANRRGRRATRVHSVWIRYDSDKPVVCEASVEIAVDEDVCLRGIVIDSQRKCVIVLTGLRSLCMISIECRYCNPLAASASFGVFQDLSVEGK